MNTTIQLENQTPHAQMYKVKQKTVCYPNIPQIESILERLDKKDNELFSKIVKAEIANEQVICNILASELAKIRILKRNLLYVMELSYSYKIREIAWKTN